MRSGYDTSRMRRPDRLPALRYVGSPRTARTLARILTILFVVVALALTVTPWQQTVSGKGTVVAFQPIERTQNIEAPIDGRVVRWEVVEGAKVAKGDLLVEISDNDPNILERLAQERSAIFGTLQAGERKGLSIGEKIRGLEETRRNAVLAAESRIDVARDKIQAAEQAVGAAEAAFETAKLNLERRQKLNERGLSSNRNFELAQLQYNKTRADVDRARASLNAERNSLIALEADRQKINADMAAKIEDARASLASAASDAEKARAELTKVDVRLARQATQRVVAPINGTILRVVGRQGGEMVKAGDVMAVLVPDSTKNVVELWVDGNDVPLISSGQPVRLQFEGWPALQFAGWPSIAVGTFGGQVMLVDASDDGQGRFRVLVEQDPAEDPWPSQVYLRQGAMANGWVLLNQVALGFELWRQFNGFPPVISEEEPGLGSLIKKVTKK